MLLAGKKVGEVAELTGASTSSVSRWKQAVQQGGLDALAAKPHLGKPPKLSDAQRQELVQILARGAGAAGYSTDLWTCPRVAEVILRTFGVEYHVDHVWKLLRKLDYTPQKPTRRAREQNSDEVRRFREQRWPRLKKRP